MVWCISQTSTEELTLVKKKKKDEVKKFTSLSVYLWHYTNIWVIVVDSSPDATEVIGHWHWRHLIHNPPPLFALFHINIKPHQQHFSYRQIRALLRRLNRTTPRVSSDLSLIKSTFPQLTLRTEGSAMHTHWHSLQRPGGQDLTSRS